MTVNWWCPFVIFLLLKCAFSENGDWKDSHSVVCPNQCVCQYAHFMDLSIARWINSMQMGRAKQDKSHTENHVNNNEVSFEGDESYLSNPYIKMATCILQSETESKEFFNNLPQDIQALAILYTAAGKNKTVRTSDLNIFTDLTTLEIRGPRDRTLQLLMDEPLGLLQNANFESINLVGNEQTKRPKNPVHPSESFDYVPNSEKIGYNISLEIIEEEDLEILPYDVYLMEIKKSRMASFYGWENLEVLRIHDCKLDELHWEMFDGLSELQHLSLEHNEIKVVPAFALYGALHIKTLSLARNSILDLNYRSLAGLLELEVLDLSHNNITKLSELTFPPFPKLEYIDFRYNPIRYIFSATFGVMNNTKAIFIGSTETQLELSGNDPFEFLEVLDFLSISNVSITVLEQSVFKSLRNLQVLRLRGSIQKIDFDAFAHMKKLREIDLSNCNLKKVSMDAFIGCNNLEKINLSKNNLSYIPPGIFDDQNIVKEIYLQDNALKHLSSTFFTKPSLRLVRLTGNPWRCTCDMALWKPILTNIQKGPPQESCIKDFHTSKVISCRKVDNYKINNKLTPRCSNLKGRTVYYALRKSLKCNLRKELERHLKQRARGLKKGSKYKHIEQEIRDKDNSSNGKAHDRRTEWQRERNQKIVKTIHSMNSLDHLTSNNNFNISHSVLGRADEEHSVINYI